METINVRYGESVDFAVASDDVTAISATLYVGNPGDSPVITKTVPLLEGIAAITLDPEDTRVPVGEYRYQVNVDRQDGGVEKYPQPEDCGEDGLPKFVVHESLGLSEVS